MYDKILFDVIRLLKVNTDTNINSNILLEFIRDKMDNEQIEMAKYFMKEEDKNDAMHCLQQTP